MHAVNTWNYRVNAIFTLLSTTMFILLGLNAATRPFLHKEPVVDIKMNQLLALYVVRLARDAAFR